MSTYETPPPMAVGMRGFGDDVVADDVAEGNSRPEARQARGLTLRPYQITTVNRVLAAIEAGHRGILIVSPTGSGKTVTGAELIRLARRKGQRVLVLVHRRELVTQTSAKLHAAGVDHGIVAAGFPTRPGEGVQIASVQTLHARAVRGSAMELPPADLVIVDEAHHIRARTYRRLIDAYPGAIVVGLTATPCRGDGRGLGVVFSTLIESASVSSLIAAGFLVPTRVYAPSTPDLKGIRVERGDFVESQLADRMDKPELIGDVVTNWLRLANRRPTVVFATGVAHSGHVRDEFCRAGVVAEHIDGRTSAEERDRILAALGKSVEVVSNAAVLTEGWDCPAASCLVLARPTRSLGLYRQMVGRVLRPARDKTDALILDHSGATFQHGFAEDDIRWTLEEDARADNASHAARGSTSSVPSLTTCPECSAVRFQGRECQVCGWRPRVKPKAIEFTDGDLCALGRDGLARPDADDGTARYAFFRQLLFVADERGYKQGWAAHKFRERYGAWPSWRNAAPMTPEPATRSWIRSRQIAYARGLQARGATA